MEKLRFETINKLFVQDQFHFNVLGTVLELSRVQSTTTIILGSTFTFSMYQTADSVKLLLNSVKQMFHRFSEGASPASSVMVIFPLWLVVLELKFDLHYISTTKLSSSIALIKLLKNINTKNHIENRHKHMKI